MEHGDEWLRSRPGAAWEYPPRLPLTWKWFVILGDRESLCLFPLWASYVHIFSLFSLSLSIHPDGIMDLSIYSTKTRILNGKSWGVFNKRTPLWIYNQNHVRSEGVTVPATYLYGTYRSPLTLNQEAETHSNPISTPIAQVSPQLPTWFSRRLFP